MGVLQTPLFQTASTEVGILKQVAGLIFFISK